MSIHIVEDLQDYYQQMMSTENTNKIILCYFTATWCGPCRMISKDVETIGTQSDIVTVLKIDVDDCEEVSNQCNIDCMPTFKFHLNNNLEPYKELMGADKTQLFNILGDLIQNLEAHQILAKTSEGNVEQTMEVPNMYNPIPDHKF